MRDNCPENIAITKMDIECEGNNFYESYGNPNSSSFDGIHLRGSQKVPYMTRSFVKMITKTFPYLNPVNKNKTNNNPKNL